MRFGALRADAMSLKLCQETWVRSWANPKAEKECPGSEPGGRTSSHSSLPRIALYKSVIVCAVTVYLNMKRNISD